MARKHCFPMWADCFIWCLGTPATEARAPAPAAPAPVPSPAPTPAPVAPATVEEEGPTIAESRGKRKHVEPVRYEPEAGPSKRHSPAPKLKKQRTAPAPVKELEGGGIAKDIAEALERARGTEDPWGHITAFMDKQRADYSILFDFAEGLEGQVGELKEGLAAKEEELQGVRGEHALAMEVVRGMAKEVVALDMPDLCGTEELSPGALAIFDREIAAAGGLGAGRGKARQDIVSDMEGLKAEVEELEGGVEELRQYREQLFMLREDWLAERVRDWARELPVWQAAIAARDKRIETLEAALKER